MKGVFILLVLIAGASCDPFEDDYRRMTDKIIQNNAPKFQGRRLKQRSVGLTPESKKLRSEFSKKLKKLVKEEQASSNSDAQLGTQNKDHDKNNESRRKLHSKKSSKHGAKKSLKKGKRTRKSAHRKGKHARKAADENSFGIGNILREPPEAIGIGNILRGPPEAIGIHANTDAEKILSAAGTTALGYGVYNYLTRKQSFKEYGKRLVEGYKIRERVLGVLENQVNQMREISMGLCICKNRVKRIGSLFAESVLNRIKPGSSIF